MPFKTRIQPLVVVLLATALSAGAAAADLTAAYSAILRGEYETGKAKISSFAAQFADDVDIKQATSWLGRYENVIEARKDVKRKTFDWNVSQARAALGDGDPYLALTFTARAIPYALEDDPFADAAWTEELEQIARDEAHRLERDQQWSKAMAYWALLERIRPNSDEIELARERAERHARIELIYDSEEELFRQIDGANYELLHSVVKFVDRNYYERPNFRRIAVAGLKNIQALTEVEKLRDFVDGLANPATRSFFAQRLRQLSDRVAATQNFSYRDFLGLYKDLENENKASVEMPEALLVKEFLEGATKNLDDYTSVVWPVDAPDFDKLMLGGFEGVGIQLGKDEFTHRLRVVTPLEDSPALEAGVQAGDLIVEVEGKSTKGWTTEDAVRNIMGKAGTTVKLTMFRPSTGERITFPVTRGQIVLKTVRGMNRLDAGRSQDWNYILDEETGVAYIKLTQFLADSAKEMEGALAAAERQGMRGLILDLRNNPGGFLHVAVDIVSLFINRGDVVSTNGLRDPRQTYAVSGRAKYADLPVVVLVNEGSASASEIFSGAFQDHRRGIVLGSRTFGKGMVQKILPLGRDARLKITTALYYLQPSGRTPHKESDAAEMWGVEPDWTMKLNPKELRQLMEMGHDAYVIKSGPDSAQQAAKKQHTEALEALTEQQEDDEQALLSTEDIEKIESDPVAVPEVDPQLELALLQMRVKLAANLPWPSDLAVRPITIEP